MPLGNIDYSKFIIGCEWSPSSNKEIGDSFMKNGVKEKYHAFVNVDDN